MARHRPEEAIAVEAPQLQIADRLNGRLTLAVLEQRDLAEVSPRPESNRGLPVRHDRRLAGFDDVEPISHVAGVEYLGARRNGRALERQGQVIERHRRQRREHRDPAQEVEPPLRNVGLGIQAMQPRPRQDDRGG